MQRCFFYFFPGVQKAAVTDDFLAELGLLDRLGGADGYGLSFVQTGPTGESGALARISCGVVLHYKPEHQEWKEFKRFWIGWPADGRPRPEDLLRPEAVRGVPIPLGDGNEWEVASAMLQPTYRDYDGETWSKKISEDKAELWDFAEKLLDDVWTPINEAHEAWTDIQIPLEARQESGAEITQQEIINANEAANRFKELAEQIDPSVTARILGINYRVGPEEIAALKLLLSDPMRAGATSDYDVLDAFVCGGLIRQIRKKK